MAISDVLLEGEHISTRGGGGWDLKRFLGGHHLILGIIHNNRRKCIFPNFSHSP